jgi:prolyl-tRNA synthetase
VLAVRWSQVLIPTQKETPADAVAPSHRLLLRAGMIRQLGAGAYSYLPLGLRVLHKAERIVREEMNAAGALELLMPALNPIEIWEESGRAATMDDILMKITLTGERKVVLGPTHEEAVTDIARDLIKSYKQLPITLYQIQTKFRNEPRPRFGIVRTREFLMKDAYSFGTSVEQLAHSYDAMYEAYCRIYDRCGLPYVVVEAESGPIGGDSSHEFMVPCATGEDVVLQCPSCGYAANRERAEVGAIPRATPHEPDAPPPAKVATPGKRTIEEISTFLKVKPEATAKLLVFLADEQPVGVLIRGDHEANESKIRRALQAKSLEPADAAQIQQATAAPMGFLGPIACQIPLLIDQSIAASTSIVTGGNEIDVHLKGVIPGRDFPLDRTGDFRHAAAGDPCPRCGNPMSQSAGMEIGHVFKLGTKYSVSMNATFLDEQGHAHPLIMGCYGIGVNRIIAGAVETCHDADGIIWPWSLAPYQAVVVPLQVNQPEVMAKAVEIAQALEMDGVDVLIDDRDLRPGPKFKDADLIGFPLRIVVGERGLKEGTVELKWRAQKDPRMVPLATAAQEIVEAARAHRGAAAAHIADRQRHRASLRSAAS